MQRLLTPLAAILLSLTITATLHAQATQPAPVDRYSFDLSPVPPPIPALKYEFLFNDDERHPGNAAGLYCDAMLTMGTELDQKFDNAEEALIDHHDVKTFISIMDSLSPTPELYDELDLAARCEFCDWNSHLRERGIQSLLPHLNACRMLGRAIYLRATRQGQLGQVADALSTLRLGYELANKISAEPAEVSGLVSVGMIVYFNDALIKLMSRPESPNLYWALCNLPACTPTIRLDGDRLGTSPPNFPALPHNKPAEELSANQWRATLTSLANLPYPEHKFTRKSLDPIRDASPDVFRQALDDYARIHSLTSDQAASMDIDPAILLGTFYFSQYNTIYDDFRKLRNLPLPLQRTLMQAQASRVEQLIAQQPANPYLPRIPYVNNAVETAARADRQLAALTAVEALRSYAASHAGALPPSLADVTETPVPPNPMTGLPFDYRLDGPTATLSAQDPRIPLSYTIHIRK